MFYPKLERAERIVLASPMFFGHMTAQAKQLIDRCQCFYARKYIVKRPMPPLSTQRLSGLRGGTPAHPV